MNNVCIEGVIDFNGNTKVPCKVEFSETVFGNQVVMHIPENVDVCNILHSVYIKTDLPKVELSKNGNYEG